jgi:tetrahydromethanopterin S-methyltransferase subunit E
MRSKEHHFVRLWAFLVEEVKVAHILSVSYCLTVCPFIKPGSFSAVVTFALIAAFVIATFVAAFVIATFFIATFLGIIYEIKKFLEIVVLNHVPSSLNSVGIDLSSS